MKKILFILILILLSVIFLMSCSNQNISGEARRSVSGNMQIKYKELIDNTNDNFNQFLNNVEPIIVENTNINRGSTASKGLIVVALDGSGDYTNIQDAFDNVNSGDTILIKQGTYELASYVTLNNKNNIIIKGDSSGQTIIRQILPFGGHLLFYIANSKNIIVKDLTFITDNDNLSFFTAGIRLAGINSALVKDIIFENLVFEDFDIAIDLNGPDYISNIKILNSNFIDNRVPFARTLPAVDINNVEFRNNYVYRQKPSRDLPGGGMPADPIFGPGLGEINNLIIDNNTIISDLQNANFNVSQSVLFFSPNAPATNIYIRNNLFQINSRYNTNLNCLSLNNYFLDNNTFGGEYDILLYIMGANVEIDRTSLEDSINVFDSDLFLVENSQMPLPSLKITNSEIIKDVLQIYGNFDYYMVDFNYYYNYEGVDNNNDGIGDTPHQIYDGDHNLITEDLHPRMAFGYCNDGTFAGQCSINKPNYCNYYVELVSNCQECGCPEFKQCQDNGECISFIGEKEDDIPASG